MATPSRRVGVGRRTLAITSRNSRNSFLLFRHPYTKIELIERDLGLSRPIATKYLVALTKAGFVRKTKLGRTNFYIKQPLFALLSN